MRKIAEVSNMVSLEGWLEWCAAHLVKTRITVLPLIQINLAQTGIPQQSIARENICLTKLNNKYLFIDYTPSDPKNNT